MHGKILRQNYLRIIYASHFWAYTLCSSISLSTIIVYASMGPFLLQSTLKLSPVAYGLAQVMGAFIATSITSQLHEMTQQPMAIVLAILGAAAVIVFSTLSNPSRKDKLNTA